jgi:Fur family ferric uptake transcriptional regulator
VPDAAAPDALAEVLRARGLRLTAPRQMVLEAVYGLGHATPDQIHAEVAKRAAGVNITTVYRTLELLEELGLVDEMPSPALASLVSQLQDTRGFLLDIGHVALFGRCVGCAGKAESC